ncbi:MAG: TraR/DksA C4-type zinc finger protein [Sphingopyxis solisilvae]|uniref:TraR/DksA C4-type zinc finger protein n=1 Tax=Sphingopyxis solisilvae TaxID=1886788 RepID=UPI004036AEBD
MRHAGNRAIEHAEAMVDLERERQIASVRKHLAKQGSASCGDCGDEIPAERRAALPSARRCADCETRRERAAKRGW